MGTSEVALHAQAAVGAAARFGALVGPFGAVLAKPYALAPGNVLDRVFSIYGCQTGNLSALFSGAQSLGLEPLWGYPVTGAGTDLSADVAQFKAICETAERYCASVLLEREYRVASAVELGPLAFNWRSLPRLSSWERAIAGQLFSSFDPDAPMRWVPSWELVQRTERWIPAVMTHLYPRPWSAERFWNQISTGLAVHTDIRAAIVTAIAEVVERDAIALTWLLRRPLTRLTFSKGDLRAFAPAIAGLLVLDEYRMYDATTDFGLPTVYVHRCRPGHPYAANLVACASDFSYARATVKSLQEIAALSCFLDHGIVEPKDDPMISARQAHEPDALFVLAELAQPRRSATACLAVDCHDRRGSVRRRRRRLVGASDAGGGRERPA
jgi:ribosomal protein S12 methylthiotransferase accessory factor